MSDNLNKNISIWRGSSSPPTTKHLWIVDEKTIKIYKDEEWIDILSVNDIILNINNEIEDLNVGILEVMVSTDPTLKYNEETDNIEGKVYLRLNGVFVNGYQYGVSVPATEDEYGGVKLTDGIIIKSISEETGETEITINNGEGIAVTPEGVVNLFKDVDELIDGGILAPADDDTYGFVKLSGSSFEQDDDGGIIAPTELGVAATPQLVFNTLATAKEYTDEQTNFSDDFTRSNDDNKLYIAWQEIAK